MGVKMELNFFEWKSKESEGDASSKRLPLVFLHGMGGTGQIWRAITAQLEDDFRCIAPDQRGHGASRQIPLSETNLFHATDYAKDVQSLLDKLSISRCYLIGHSMGVRTALALAALDPSRIAGLIAVDIGISSAWGGGIGAPLANFIEKLPEVFPDRTLMKTYLNEHCPDPAIAQYLGAVAKKTSDDPETWVFPFDHQSLVKTIYQADEAPIEDWLMNKILPNGVKTTFLHGERSKVWLQKDFEEQRNRFHHPLLEFQDWENCGHGLPFEQRARFIEFIRNFTAN